MLEWTVYAMEDGGQVGGMGITDAPSLQAIDLAKDHNVFSRGGCRIHVLVVSGTVTVEQQRQLAVAFYEGRGRKVDFDDAARAFRTPALCADFATS